LRTIVLLANWRAARVNAQAAEERVEEPARHHQDRRHDDAEINAVDERAVAVFAFASAEGLRDELVEA
jgi:hypothetical protein